jgi:hypothetical protein
MGNHAVLGPNRQLTFTSLGNATGTLGVNVNVGRGVLVGKGVCVGRSVGGITVAVAEGIVIGAAVGVAGTLDGRLHASIAKTSMSAGNKVRLFIVSPIALRWSDNRMIPPS